MNARRFDAEATWPDAFLAALPSTPLPMEITAALACAAVAELQRLHREGYAQGSIEVVHVEIGKLATRAACGFGAPTDGAPEPLLGAATDSAPRIQCRLHGAGVPAAALGHAARLDLQALGKVLFHCATGRSPTPHPALRRTLPDLPRALCDVIAALCQADPVRPYRSAAGARADLELARALLLDGQPSDTFSLARREPRAA